MAGRRGQDILWKNSTKEFFGIKKMKFKTKYSTIREFRKGDEISLQKNINHKYIYHKTSTIPYPYTMKHAREWIKKTSSKTKSKKKKFYYFAIDISNEVAGGISIDNIGNGKGEIGYWLAKKYWKRGIISRSVKIISNFGLTKLKLVRIYAHVLPANKASRRVLEKNKFKLEGILRKTGFKDGKYFDCCMYAKVR